MRSMRCLVDLFSTFVVGVSLWFTVSNSEAQQIEAEPSNTAVNDLEQLASTVSSASKGSEQEFEQNGNGEKVLRLPSFSNPVKAGVIRPGSKVNFRLKVENPLAVPLHILGGEASCACTEIRAEQGVIEPKGTGFVLMKIDAGPKETNRAVVGSLLATTQSNTTEEAAGNPKDAIRVPFRLLFTTREECSFSNTDMTSELASGPDAKLTMQIRNYSNLDWLNPRLTIEPPHLEASIEFENEENKDTFSSRQTLRVRLVNSRQLPLTKSPDGQPTPLTLKLFSSNDDSGTIFRQVGESTLNVSIQQEIELAPKSIDLNSTNSSSVGVHVISRDRNIKLEKELIEFVLADSGQSVSIVGSKSISDRWVYFELDRESLAKSGLKFEILVRCFLDATKSDWREAKLLVFVTN